MREGLPGNLNAGPEALNVSLIHQAKTAIPSGVGEPRPTRRYLWHGQRTIVGVLPVGAMHQGGI